MAGVQYVYCLVKEFSWISIPSSVMFFILVVPSSIAVATLSINSIGLQLLPGFYMHGKEITYQVSFSSPFFKNHILVCFICLNRQISQEDQGLSTGVHVT